MSNWAELSLLVAGYLLCLVLLAWAIGEFLAWVSEKKGKK